MAMFVRVDESENARQLLRQHQHDQNITLKGIG